MMELILSKRLQKERKLKKQQPSDVSRLNKLLPDDLYKSIARKSRSYR